MGSNKKSIHLYKSQKSKEWGQDEHCCLKALKKVHSIKKFLNCITVLPDFVLLKRETLSFYL